MELAERGGGCVGRKASIPEGGGIWLESLVSGGLRRLLELKPVLKAMSGQGPRRHLGGFSMSWPGQPQPPLSRRVGRVSVGENVLPTQDVKTLGGNPAVSHTRCTSYRGKPGLQSQSWFPGNFLSGGQGAVHIHMSATLSGERAGQAGPRLETLELHFSRSVAEPSGALREAEPNCRGHVWGAPSHSLPGTSWMADGGQHAP